MGLTAAACSVPRFDFDGSSLGAGGGAPVVAHCTNGELDRDSGESDFDCGRGCDPCGAGKHCGDVADCQDGLVCADGTCLEAGCTNRVQDGAETDTDCGGGGCNGCVTGQACRQGSDCESSVCRDAECQAVACDDRVSNGQETGLDCGGDCSPCPADEACLTGKDCVSGECNERVCGVECPEGFANCDGDNGNGCESSLGTDAKNCAFCGNECDLPHAAAECSAGECRIETDGCEPGYQDCNGDPADGCEVDLETNKLNCGACHRVCPDLNGAPSCAAGQCEITCDDGFADCDKSTANGCEVNVDSSSTNCHECGKVCSAAAGYSAYCKQGSCGQTACAAGKGDCNGNPADACETTLSNDVNNCGACGLRCEAVNAVVDCVNGKCVVSDCKANFADCAGGYADGCETNTQVSTSHCGGCGRACTIDNGSPKCDGGACEVNSCGGPFRDCDGDPKNGCEINIVSGDKSNCGACNAKCGASNASATTCTASTCDPTCNPGWGKCATPDQGCVTPLGTTANCTKCGQVCSGATPICGPTGCMDHRDIVVVSPGVHATQGWSGGASALAEIKLSHTLQTAKSGGDNNRMILVGVGATDNYTSPENISVSYAGAAMIPMVEKLDANKHSYAGIYYLLDAALPEAGAGKQLVVSLGGGFTWGHGGVDLLELKNVTQAAPLATGSSSGDNCSNGINRGATITFNQPGSLVYGFLAARGASQVTLTDSASGIVQSFNKVQASPDRLGVSGAYLVSDNTHTMTWDLLDCQNSAIALVALKRVGAN